jgi:signal transduction histidine kinase
MSMAIWTGYGHMMKPVQSLRRDVRAHVWDYALSGAMSAAALVALVTRIDVQDFDAFRFHGDTWWSWALTVAICTGLVGRRRWPLRSFAVGLALMLPLELGKHRDSIAFFALVIAFYSVAANLPMRRAWRGVAMLGALYGALAVGGTTIINVAPVAGLTFFATGFALGRMRRRSRARQTREVQAAIERAAVAVETADLAAAAERLRMARELHDVVAHSLSVIAVQAGIGVHLVDRQPADAERALDAIRTTSATATNELTRLVAILRDGTSLSDMPAPSLDDVTGLVEHIRTAGVRVTLTIDGDVHDLSAGVSLAAYRIVQEALTNVVRHAGRAESTVTIRVSDELIDLLIDDDGRGATALDGASCSGGNGIVGMRERAQMYGGDVHCGLRPGGGFRVHATLQPTTNSPTLDSYFKPAVGSATELHLPTKRWRPSPWVWDVLLAVLMAVLGISEIFKSEPPATGPQLAPTDRWVWLLRIGGAMVLVARRRYPTLTLAATWLVAIALALGNYQLGVSIFILWIALYSVGSYASTRQLVVGSIGSLVGMAIIAWSEPPDLTATGAAWICFMFTAAAVAGYVARRDRERLHTDLSEREGTAEASARRALLDITAERLRIADELGTVITRSIHSIANHAGTGSQRVSTDPAAARGDLEVISTISRDALSDLRRLLKRIRTETEPAVYRPVTPSRALVPTGDTP